MENHHLAASFRVLRQHNFLAHLPKADRDQIRKVRACGTEIGAWMQAR